MAVVVGAAGASFAADVDVIDWTLNTSVLDGSPSIPQIDSEYSQVPQNPFDHTMSVSLGAEDTAVGAFDVSWMNDTGVFHLAAEQHLHGPHRGASSNGIIYLRTTVDLIFNVSGNMTYSSTPGDEADFIFGLTLVGVDPMAAIYDDGGQGGDLNLFTPASGSLQFDSGNIILPAGNTYRVQLNFQSDTYFHPDQDPIFANGEINFFWRPVPEPATGLLFAFAGIALLRRRRRPVSSTTPTHDAPSPAVP